MTSYTFKQLIKAFHSPNRNTQVSPFISLNSSPGIILPIQLFVQKAQTGRGKLISNINDCLGTKPTVFIVAIATRP